MRDLIMKSMLTGIFWGIWPLMMNKSGLNGNVSPLVFIGIMLVCVLPFTIGNIGSAAGVNWMLVVIASMLGAAGTILFNRMLSDATLANVGLCIVITTVVETVTPAVYQMCNNGVTIRQGIGFIFAVVSVVLLIL